MYNDLILASTSVFIFLITRFRVFSGFGSRNTTLLKYPCGFYSSVSGSRRGLVGVPHRSTRFNFFRSCISDTFGDVLAESFFAFITIWYFGDI